MSTAYFQKNQPNLIRGIQKKCQVCSKDFSFRRRQHQCKRCLRAVCSQCSNQKIVCYKIGFIRSSHRGCKICCEQVKQITEYIEENQLQFGRMSNVAIKWMSRIEKKPLTASLDNRKYKKFTREVFDCMWDSYNYSLREFIGMLTFGFDQGEVYKIVNEVFSSIISMVPQEDIESVAYLVIFLLCFCSPDKIPFICLNLFQQKATLANEQGYIFSILRALGVNESTQQKLKEYIKFKGKRYINAFSVNSVNVKESIEIIQKILTKKKIDQIYICFSISLELLKDIIMTIKDPFVCDLMFVRHCTFQALNSKYKQANSVKIINYLHKKKQIQAQAATNTSLSRELQITNEKEQFARFTEQIKGVRQNTKPFIYSDDSGQKKPQQLIFRKRQVKQESFIQDSFSVISMIDEMNQQANKKNEKLFENQANQLLNLMMQAQSEVEQKPINTLQLKKNGINNFQNNRLAFNPNSMKKQCEKCIILNETMLKLTKEIEAIKMQKNTIQEDYKKQNNQLMQRIKNSTNNSKANQNYILQKMDYQSQIRKLKLTIQQHEQKQKGYILQHSKNQQYKKLIKKQEQDLRITQQQLEQATINIKMFKNKLESQSFSLPQQRSQSENTDAIRINQILKQNLREKNQQIEELSKKNKIILYQLQQLSKERANDKEKIQLKERMTKIQKQKEQILNKMKELSNLLMQQESEKLSLSEQNFQLQEILKENGIKLNKY